jgi:hypothetical protein
MLALTELSERSTLDEEVEMLLELALTTANAPSTLAEEFDRLRLDT